MKALLLTGSEKDAHHITTQASYDGDVFIDWQIRKLQELKFEVVVVLSGAWSEEILRKSREIANVEIVYDTDNRPCLFSNLVAGLSLTHRESMVLPVQIPCPEQNVWASVQKVYWQNGYDSKADIVRPYCPIQGELVAGYPLLVTLSGRLKYLHDVEVQSLNHASIIELKTPVLNHCITNLSAKAQLSPW